MPEDTRPDVTTGTIDREAWQELITAWCTNAAECYSDDPNFTPDCIAESEYYVDETEEEIGAYGQDCLDAYIAYLRCGADNLVCYDGDEYDRVRIDGCETELDVLYFAC